MLTAFKLYHSPFPFTPHRSYLTRKPGCSFLWCWQEVPNVGALDHAQESSPQPHPLTTRNSPKQCPFPALPSHLHTSLGAHPALGRKPPYLGNKLFQTLLLHMWHCHQSKHPNFILGVEIPILLLLLCSLVVGKLLIIAYCYLTQLRSFTHIC